MIFNRIFLFVKIFDKVLNTPQCNKLNCSSNFFNILIQHLIHVSCVWTEKATLQGRGVLKIWNKITGEHPCWSAISMKLLCNFIEILLPHGFSPINLLHIFRTPFPKNYCGELLLELHAILNWFCLTTINIDQYSQPVIEASCGNWFHNFPYKPNWRWYQLMTSEVRSHALIEVSLLTHA